MPRRLPSSALDQQTQITASSTGAILAGNWYIGTGGAGSGGAVAGTLTGPLVGNADTATAWKNKVVVNGTDLIGNVTPITIGVNTTSIATSGTYYPTFVPSNTAGNQQASTNTNFKYDPNTGYLSATRFVGSGAGLTDLIIPSYGLSAVDGAGSTAKVRLYSSSTVGATYAFNQNTAVSIQRIQVGFGALDAGETALRAVFYTTNPNTGQPYGDLNGDGAVDQSDSIIILQLVAGSISPTARSNQLLAAIGASANAGAIVTYGWINSSLAGDVTLAGSGGITVSRTNNTITFNAPAVDLTGYATETYVTTRGYLTSAPVTSVNGQTGAVTVSSPTAVSSLSQDTVLFGGGGYTYGMGVVPGYTYTITNGVVDVYTETWSVPTTGWWSFTSIAMKASGQRLDCSGWLSTTAYLIGCLEVNISGFGWRTVATRSWDAINVLNSLTADGGSRKVGESSAYFSSGLGWGTSDTRGNDFRKPYYLSAGEGVRFRFLWATTLPTYNETNTNTGILDSNDVFNPIIVPTGPDYEWRAYWLGGGGGYWYVGCRVQWSAVRTG